ncbi:MAG: tetratricopeptide repeat protein [Thermoanaerobaculia bacterium]|jgi:cytochrome c-type biogenesis protein CcmH
MIAFLLQEGSAPVEWTLPVAMLVGGLVIGVIVAIIVGRRGAKARQDEASPEATTRELEIRDLGAQRDSLFDQLRELDDTSSKRDAEQLAVERYDLELQAARTLQRLDELTGRHAPASPLTGKAAGSEAAAGVEAAVVPRSPLKGFLWGMGSAAAIAALVLFVAKSAEERGDSGSMTGNTPMSSGGGMQGGETQTQDAEMQQLLARVQAEPDNLDLRVELAFQQLMREQLMQVFDTTQYVLERRPGDPAALTYQSVVRLAMGQTVQAEQMLRQAIKAKPELLDAHVYLALALSQAGKYDEAKTAIDDAIKLSPGDSERIRALWTQIEAQKAAGPAQAAGGKEDPHAGIALPPMAGEGVPATGSTPAPAAPSAPSNDPRAVRGKLALAGGAKVPPGATVFLIVRPAGVKGGPPVAVSRIPASAFPMSFELSQLNSMMGQPLPDSMLIEARVDLDGNPMTRDAGAPDGVADNVAAGSPSVTITLAVK